jgi:DNA modification methylase
LEKGDSVDMFPEHRKGTISVQLGDSRHLPLKNCCGDFTITSPPYWCLEDYGSEKEQIGKCSEYPEFRRQLRLIMAENFRVLRAGSFCVWCVNDFTWEGKFYNFHGNCIEDMREVGFKQHDCVITDFGTSMGQMFASDIVNHKRLPKRHEYNLIFVKP